MAGVAVHGSRISEVIKPNHVTYRIDTRDCEEYNEYGNCVSYSSWYFYGNGAIDAKITGTVSVPSSNLKIQGQNVAKVGDPVQYSWSAVSSIPSNTTYYRYTATSDTSGSGTGVITGGSVKGKLAGQSIALIGSEVEVLGVTTTIADGNTKINFSN